MTKKEKELKYFIIIITHLLSVYKKIIIISLEFRSASDTTIWKVSDTRTTHRD